MDHFRLVFRRSWDDSWKIFFAAPKWTVILAVLVWIVAFLCQKGNRGFVVRDAVISGGWTVLATVIVFAGVFVFHLCYLTPKRIIIEKETELTTATDKVAALERAMKPRMRISGGRSVDKCFIYGNDFFFRAKLESLGTEPIHKVEAHITEIRRDGEPVELNEVGQLMMHPGCPTLPLLKHKVDGFIDIIKTDSNTQPLLALAWPYASLDATLVASGHTYQIDIAVSSETAPTQTCTFVFTWKGEPFTSEFEMLETNLTSIKPLP